MVVVLIVNAEDAFIRDPSLMFLFQKSLYSVVPDVPQVIHLAHSVACAIAFIQVLQPFAGKLVTGETEFSRTPGAGPQSAEYNRLEMVAVDEITPVARVLFPWICLADTAVHAAGRNDLVDEYRFIHKSSRLDWSG